MNLDSEETEVFNASDICKTLLEDALRKNKYKYRSNFGSPRVNLDCWEKGDQSFDIINDIDEGLKVQTTRRIYEKILRYIRVKEKE